MFRTDTKHNASILSCDVMYSGRQTPTFRQTYFLCRAVSSRTLMVVEADSCKPSVRLPEHVTSERQYASQALPQALPQAVGMQLCAVWWLVQSEVNWQ